MTEQTPIVQPEHATVTLQTIFNFRERACNSLKSDG
ncbi:hypothetical protein BDD30_2335 [Photorhabdus asymbiotica]|uniref:Uncharacterized protein n=1 Tax=Photorhabdus asymbiotica TaxID=291112 RepID=A0ABX9SQ91_9GAMM|nr:hypothetical protein BDD30_2335 [Photorhabdus asymbiotica]